MDTGLATKMDATTKLNGIPLANGNLDLNNNRITNLADGINSKDGVNVTQLNTKRNSMDGLDAIAANGNVNLSSYKITNLGPATLASDAVRFD